MTVSYVQMAICFVKYDCHEAIHRVLFIGESVFYEAGHESQHEDFNQPHRTWAPRSMYVYATRSVRDCGRLCHDRAM